MRILLTEGSGLTSRQVATLLGRRGHEVELLTSNPICLTRFTRYVRKVHEVPQFGGAPLAWFEAATAIARERSVDVLLPTQEQVAVLSAMRAMLEVATIVPAFESLHRMQDKISAYRTLQAYGMPQPAAVIVNNTRDLSCVERFPVFVKRPISTASAGVLKASSPAELAAAVESLGGFGRELLVQALAAGPLAMVQAVADCGRLIALHACTRIQEGVGGGAAVKESTCIPGMTAHLERLIDALKWHGPLSLDVILAAAGPLVIDVNPRLVEPMNAFLAGVDLVGAILDLALDRHPPPQPAGRSGVRSFQLLLAVLGAAANEGSRTAVIRELLRAARRQVPYTEGLEELTPIAGDPVAAMPVLAAATATLLQPSLWRAFHNAAVGSYSLTPSAWDKIVKLAAQFADVEPAESVSGTS